MKTLRDLLRRAMFFSAKWARDQVLRIRRLDFWDLVVLVSVLSYGIVFSYFTLLKHNVFQSYAWDLGIFDQAMYTTLHGHFLYYTAESFMNISGCYFAQHISPILLLILPLYAIQTSATTLLVMKSFVLALGAIPLYLIALTELNNKKTGVVLVLLYLLYPALQAANWFDFQPQVFLPLTILSAFYFFRKERWSSYFLSVILALMVEEHIPIVVFVLSAFLFINDWKTFVPSLRNRRLNRALIAFVTMIICAVWFFLAFYIKGTFPINQEFMTRYQASGTFSVLGLKGDLLGVPLAVLTNPQGVWDALMYDYATKFIYVVLLFGPLLFIPFRDKLSLGIFAILSMFLLSNYWAYYALGAHYPLYVLPLIFIATVGGLKHFHPTSRNTILKIALLVTILFVASTSPISPISKSFIGSNHILWYPDVNFAPTEQTDTLHKLLDLIPPEASVLTQNHLFAHVSSRQNAYVIPAFGRFKNDTDYLSTLINKSDYVLLDLIQWDPLTANVYDQIVKNRSFELYALGSQSVLFRRDYHGEPLYKEYLENRVYVAYRDLAVSGNGRVTPDSSVDTGNSIVCPRSTAGIISYGPYAYLLPGVYQVTFAVKAGEHGDGYLGTLDVSQDVGQSVLSKRDFYGFELQTNKWANFTLTFTSTTLIRNVEYRSFSAGSADVYIDRVYVKRISYLADSDFGSETLAPGSMYSIPSAHLLTATGDMTNEGFLVHYHNQSDDVFWFGPYWPFIKGNYTLTFLLKISPLPQNVSERILTLRVLAEESKIVTEHEVYSSSYSDGNQNSEWRSFTINIEIKISLGQVQFMGLEPSTNYDIYLAYILVEKAN